MSFYNQIILLILLFYISDTAAQEGIFKTYYSSGAVESEINYRNNIREGEAKFYYGNGNLKEERNYINGRVEGLLKIYNENGKLIELANIENGKREGPSSYFNEEGEYLTDIEFIEGRRIKPEPVIEEPLIALNETNEIKDPPVKKENNLKKTGSLFVPPSLEDTMDDDPAFFATAEVMPQPVGGMSAIYKRLVYPREARLKKIEGTVNVLIYIDEYGDVTQAEVVDGIGYGCDESAKTTLFYTKFSPGLIRGKAVKMRIVVPVEFRIDS